MNLSTQPFALLAALIGVLPAAFFFGLIISASGESRAPLRPLPPSKYDAELVKLNKEAVRDAYHAQIVHLFQTWMKDDTGQPQRAVTGAQNARRAYIAVMTELDKTEANLP